MKALILAAGRGSRMKNLTDEMPKCLIKLKGKTLLEYQLEAIRKAKVKEIGIVTGYKKEKLKNFGLTEFYNQSWDKSNMVSSLECAEQWFKNEPLIVSYSDIFYEESAIIKLKKCKDNLAITYDPNWYETWKKRFKNPLDDAETFRINKSNMLTEIGGKTDNVSEIQGQYMGLLYISPQGWKIIKNLRKNLGLKKRNEMEMTQMLSQITKNEPLFIRAIPYYGVWGEIDSKNDIKVFENQ
tara:strand:+ start:377 stop:1096 length:720 start_codon:yes stop_codon:yes gene_type:complete